VLLLQGSCASSSMDCCGHLAPCVGDRDALQTQHVVVVGRWWWEGCNRVRVVVRGVVVGKADVVVMFSRQDCSPVS
jgi:hypothetical protein